MDMKVLLASSTLCWYLMTMTTIMPLLVSGNVNSCNGLDGLLRPLPLDDGAIRVSETGSLQYVLTSVLEICVNGMFGGICNRGFDDVDAIVACRFIGYTDGRSI